jgi:GGDEF domain-containing protein
VPNGEARLGASVGLALGRAGRGIRADALMKAADVAVYEAKRTGKGRVVTSRGDDASSPGPLAA